MQNLVLALASLSVRQVYSIENAGARIKTFLNINMNSIIIMVHTGVCLDLDMTKEHTFKDT